MLTIQEQKAKELEELFQMEEDLTEGFNEEFVAKQILNHLRKIKEHFKTKENE
jgi:hypothetical protein